MTGDGDIAAADLFVADDGPGIQDNPNDKQDSFSNPVGDFWGTQPFRTLQNSAKSVGTDGNNPL
jgi:hypothetical protein